VKKPEAKASRIFFEDGSPSEYLPASKPKSFLIEELDAEPANSGGKKRTAELLWPIFESQEQVFHSAVRLPNGEGLLIDTGAVSNVMGDGWLERASKRAREHGQGTELTPLQEEQPIGGVGKQGAVCTHHAQVPIALPNGDVGTFSGNVISESEVPALLGLRSMQEKHTLLDLQNRRMLMVGPGGYELKLSPGSKSLRLETSPSGHILLPATEWEKANASTSAESVAFHARGVPVEISDKEWRSRDCNCRTGGFEARFGICQVCQFWRAKRWAGQHISFSEAVRLFSAGDTAPAESSSSGAWTAVD
jgi:hypothetical protein